MRRKVIALSLIGLLGPPLIFAEARDAANPENPNAATEDGGITPGAVGPGSEKNARVSPTSPDVPTTSQPPPEIPANSGSVSGPAGTSGPQNPAPPENAPKE